MAILYKAFASRRTVFCALFAVFLLFSPVMAMAEGSLFTVEGVKVDITAENAMAARDQAFAEAQKQAFQTLAVRMIPDNAAQSFVPPEADVISPMIKDYEITEEKLSSVRYIATYTFRFKDKAVRNYFSGSGVAFTDVPSRPLLILPFIERSGRLVLWAPDNTWMGAWSRSESSGSLVPLVVPIGDLQDVSDIDDSEALTYDPRRLRSMLSRYQAGEAVVAIAIPDANLQMVGGENDPATGAMTVNIYRTDRQEPEHVQQIVVTPAPAQNLRQFMDLAVHRVQQALRSDWKSRTVVDAASQGGKIEARVAFRNFQEWAAVQTALDRVYGIDKIVTKSLSPREAHLELMFQGDERRLRLALEQAGLSLSESRPPLTSPAPSYYNGGYNGGWQAQQNQQNQAPVYDLSLTSNTVSPYAVSPYAQPGAARPSSPAPYQQQVPQRAQTTPYPAPSPYQGRF